MKKLIALISVAALLLSVLSVSAETTSVKQPKQMVNINAAGQATLSGTLKSIGASSLVLSSWGGDWTVTWSDSTKLMRRYDAKATWAEMAVGDAVQVQGQVSTAGFWTMAARSIRDNSIQTQSGYFNGTISNLNGATFTLTTKNRGALQVSVNADAKIMVAGQTGTLTNLSNGLMVYVSGVWNTQQSTLLASRVIVSKMEKDKQDKANAGNQ